MTDVPNVPPPGTTATTEVIEDRSRSRTAIGILLLVLGALFFLDRLGFDWGWRWHPTFDRMWPVLLIVAGLTRLSGWSRARTVTISDATGSRVVYQRDRTGGGIWLLIVGIIMLMNQNDILSIDRSWPLFIIAGGVSLILGRGPTGRFRREI